MKDEKKKDEMIKKLKEVDMQEVMEMSKKYKEVFEKKNGVKIGLMGLLKKEVKNEMKEIKDVKEEIEGKEIV